MPFLPVCIGSTWSLQQKLTKSDGAFGCAVAIDGDTLIAGASVEDVWDAGDEEGAAYIYTRSGSSWSIQGDLASLAGTDPTQGLEAGDYFGWSVDIHDNTVLVGAYRDGGVDSVGAAYAFVRNGTTWSKQQKLFAPNAGSGGTYFGCGVSLLGDRAVIGSHYDEIDGSVLGSAHSFFRNGSA